MSVRRYFKRESLQHIFQKTTDYGNFLYTIEDSIVLLSILSTHAMKYSIDIHLLCLMTNHFHMLVDAFSKRLLYQYMDVTTSIFVRLYNKRYSRSGKLFHQSFGSASKSGEKKIRSCLAYIGNNPVEKHLCKSAIEYKWNLLPYYRNDHPFSEPLKSYSKRLGYAIKAIKNLRENNEYINYKTLDSLTNRLSITEKKWIYDFIISIYNPTNYTKSISYYGSYEKMIQAFDSNTGNEYEIKEEYINIPDSVYSTMFKTLKRNGLWSHNLNPYTYTSEQRAMAINLCLKINDITKTHLIKFFHLGI